MLKENYIFYINIFRNSFNYFDKTFPEHGIYDLHIFYATIVIGASGAAMDIAMDVAASMDEIKRGNRCPYLYRLRVLHKKIFLLMRWNHIKAQRH